jgi:hypothetical protein
MSAYWGKADMPPSRQAPRICYCVSQNATGNDQLGRMTTGILDSFPYDGGGVLATNA